MTSSVYITKSLRTRRETPLYLSSEKWHVLMPLLCVNSKHTMQIWPKNGETKN